MDLPTLLAEGEVGDDVSRAGHDLIALKAQTRELGSATPAILERFVEAQLDAAEHYESAPKRDPSRARALADEYFRAQLN
jgi:hypothetical protein